MHILFVGKCCPSHTINTIIQKTGKNPGIQIVKFSRLILEGFPPQLTKTPKNKEQIQ